MRDWQKLVTDIIRQRDREIAAAYQSGRRVRDIAAEFGLGTSRVHEIVDLHECERRGRGRWKRETE